MQSEIYRNQLFTCNKCGYCHKDCPVYRQTKDETYSARGLLTLAEAVASNKLQRSDIYKNRISTCIRCLACADNCPSGLLPFHLIQTAKEDIVEKDGMEMSKKLFCRSIAKNQWLMSKALSWGKTFGFLEGDVPKAQKNFFKVMPEVINVKKAKANIGFFVGCAINIWYPHIGIAAVKLLTDMGFNVYIPKRQKCCAVPVMSLGDLKSAKVLIKDNFDVFSGVDAIVTACASCGLMLKKDSVRLGAPDSFRSKVKDINEFLVENKVENFIKKKSNKKKVAYHDPCHLNRGQNITAEPRKLIEIAGYKLEEISNANQCCGGGGTFRLFNQELALSIAEEKIDALNSSKASMLSTSCPGCIMQFDDVCDKNDRGLPIKHIVELLVN